MQILLALMNPNYRPLCVETMLETNEDTILGQNTQFRHADRLRAYQRGAGAMSLGESSDRALWCPLNQNQRVNSKQRVTKFFSVAVN